MVRPRAETQGSRMRTRATTCVSQDRQTLYVGLVCYTPVQFPKEEMPSLTDHRSVSGYKEKKGEERVFGELMGCSVRKNRAEKKFFLRLSEEMFSFATYRGSVYFFSFQSQRTSS